MSERSLDDLPGISESKRTGVVLILALGYDRNSRRSIDPPKINQKTCSVRECGIRFCHSLPHFKAGGVSP